jgi:chromosome segregation ATPase
MVNQRQSEIEDRLTLGMRRHQEIKNKIDALSNTNVNLQEKLLNTEKALGEEEAFIRSQRADMDTLILDVKTRIGDFDSNYQSFRKNEQDIESKIEQIASNLLEIENKSLNIGQMFGEKISSVAKTLDEKDSIFEAYQKEMNSIIQGLTGKINELGSHSEHHQRKFDEVSFKINAMSDTLTGIHETINSLKNDFMQKVNSSYSEIVNQMSSFKTKLDDQHLVNDQLEEKDRIIELQLKDIGETWEKLHEQLLAKYGEMLDAIEGGKSRVQTMEEKIMGITETEEGTKKSILGLLEEFTIIQKDLQSVKEEISMKKRGEKIVENKLDMIKKIINSAETELEKHR